MQLKELVTECVEQTFSASYASKFSGYDPFDGLNSRVFNVFPPLKNSLFGLAWIQLFKRSSVNLRSVAGVPKKRNPKGIGLFILGMLEEHRRTNDSDLIATCIELADWLLSERCDITEWGASCWGYHFDWKARAFFVPKGKPNVITTIYVAQALDQLAKTILDIDFERAQLYQNAAFESANFIVEHLYTELDGRTFFAYIPGEQAFVHNASLWAAAWVAVVGEKTNNNHFLTLADKVAKQSVSEQNSDGSWVYGARHHHQFIDGFHTGYNLEALHLIRGALKCDHFDEAIDKGLQYYRSHFFEPDGTAKYYHDNPYPLDPHSVAQAIITLGKLGNGLSDNELMERVVRRAIESLYLPEKQQFVYQKNKQSVNKINYMRWTQAWMYYSLSFYLNQQESHHATNHIS